MPMRFACLILLIAFLLPACGQKGALYLPDQEPPKKDRVRP
jgi:predicted small lipoprotein YifL